MAFWLGHGRRAWAATVSELAGLPAPSRDSPSVVGVSRVLWHVARNSVSAPEVEHTAPLLSSYALYGTHRATLEEAVRRASPQAQFNDIVGQDQLAHQTPALMHTPGT